MQPDDTVRPEHPGGDTPGRDAPITDRFFADCPSIPEPQAALLDGNHRPAPDDWWLAVTDVEDSTGAIARGLHRTVNFVAASAIAALKNLCAPLPIPLLFGGDGAAVMVPGRLAEAARRELARVRGLAAREYGLVLRVGLVPVRTLRSAGYDVRVARYEPTPGNHFGLFQGGGVAAAEMALKGRGDAALAAALAVEPGLDDGVFPNLDGLSCRWSELQSQNGTMATLIIEGMDDAHEVHGTVMALAGRGDHRPAKPANLLPTWPPKGVWIEAQSRPRGRTPLLVVALRIYAFTLFSWIIIRRGKPIGNFDPIRYRDETATNTDFCVQDGRLCIVIDCTREALDAIRSTLDARAAAGRLRYGLHVSQTALMTCLVSSLDDALHVHFIDGGDGGYTRAARAMRAAALAA